MMDRWEVPSRLPLCFLSDGGTEARGRFPGLLFPFGVSTQKWLHFCLTRVIRAAPGFGLGLFEVPVRQGRSKLGQAPRLYFSLS